MFLGTHWVAVECAALAIGMSILQVDNLARVSTSAMHHFSVYISTTNQHEDPIQSAIMGFSE